jgi:hypothetical protein
MPNGTERNPWYGGKTGEADPGFGEHPTPQPRIGDLPTDPADLVFVTYLVCAESGNEPADAKPVPVGKVLFNWAWGSNEGKIVDTGKQDPNYPPKKK